MTVIKRSMNHHGVNISLVFLIQRMQNILHLVSIFIKFYCPYNNSVRGYSSVLKKKSV